MKLLASCNGRTGLGEKDHFITKCFTSWHDIYVTVVVFLSCSEKWAEWIFHNWCLFEILFV